MPYLTKGTRHSRLYVLDGHVPTVSFPKSVEDPAITLKTLLDFTNLRILMCRGVPNSRPFQRHVALHVQMTQSAILHRSTRVLTSSAIVPAVLAPIKTKATVPGMIPMQPIKYSFRDTFVKPALEGKSGTARGVLPSRHQSPRHSRTLALASLAQCEYQA